MTLPRRYPLRVGLVLLAWLAAASPGRAQSCVGDCDGNGAVSIDEIITAVGIALDSQALEICGAADADGDGGVTVDEIVGAVNSALAGCAAPRGELVIAASEPVGVVRQIPGGPTVGGTPHMPAQYRVVAPSEVRVEIFASGLEVPWAMAFAPDGRMFVNERPGRIRIVSAAGVVEPISWATPAVHAVGEGGLMGLALHPSFPDEPWVYVCYTIAVDGVTQNRISRWREVDGHGTSEEVLLDRFPGASVHDGCRLKFGPDGKLYATTGDASQRSQAQDLGSLAGKILRLNPDGSIPADNPFGPGSPVFSYGHRNPQGLAFHPRSGVLYETEHGPSGEVGIGAYDEVNIIVAGANYGWPTVVGAPGIAGLRDPLLTYPDRAVPPAGATFYFSQRIPQWTGNFFFASLGARHLQRVVLDGRGKVVAIERLFDGVYGRLRDVVEGPDGAIYVSTSNRDGRGTPQQGDDRILRMVPAE
jgi:glucose/arabinose dehydrogenase